MYVGYPIDWYLFGKRAARMASAAVGVKVSEADYADLVRRRVLATAQAYYDVLEAKGYQHSRIHHSSNVYVRGDVHTNTIEGFWSLVKNGLRGVYHSVSEKYLQSYLNEYAWRYNHRNDGEPMFWTMLGQAALPRECESHA